MDSPSQEDPAHLDAEVALCLKLFGIWANRRRNALRLSQAQMAALGGLSGTEVSHREAGRTNLTLSTFIRVCHALRRGWSLDDLHDATGIAKSHLRNLEHGRHTISPDMILTLEIVFGMVPNGLLTLGRRRMSRCLGRLYGLVFGVFIALLAGQSPEW